MKKALLFMALATTFVQCTNNREVKADDTKNVKEHLLPSSLSADLRKIPFEGASNTRDLGGIVNLDGKKVKKGMIMRSDDFTTLSKADLEKLSKYSIKTVVDFRSKNETKSMPDKLPTNIKNKVQLPISIGDIKDLEKAAKNNNADAALHKIYKDLVEDKNAQAQYKEFFNLVSNPDNLPLIFHCNAGKDRTGFATALFLSSLNVDPKVIMNDYLASDENIKKRYKKEIEKNPNLQNILQSNSAFLNTGIKLIQEKYGSIDKYLTDVLKVDVNKLRNMYLER